MGLVVTVTHSQQGCKQRVYNKGLGYSVIDMALTAMREKFCQLMASGKNQSDAYRGAFNAENMGGPTVNEEAYRLMQIPEIVLRIAELKKPIEEQVGITLKSYIEEMQALKNAAMNAEEYGASIKALELTGKVLGYYVNKTEVSGSLTLEQMTDEDLDKKIAEKLTTLQKN